jgi:hypothetical protein
MIENNIRQFLVKHNIKQFVAWGHKLHTHTHSYIHNGFIRAFHHLGYPTLWLDKDDDISQIDFENSLFLTEGQVSQNIPILSSSYYILHNVPNHEIFFNNLPSDHVVVIQVYTKDAPIRPWKKCIAPYVYLDFGAGLYMPWATDLLPHEIDENMKQLDTIVPASPPELNFIGMPTPPWDIVSNYCRIHGITYKQVGGFSKSKVDLSHNIQLIKQSIIAPALQENWQVENSYIPCRIFKNISYGKMGMTNSKTVYDLFNEKILYNSDINQLMDMGLQFESNSMEYKKEKIIPLMEFVRDHHTYLNRIQAIFDCFDLLSEE